MRRIMRLREVEKATGKKRSTIYEAMAKGKFPRAVKLGPKSVGWVEDEIADHNESLIAARDGGADASAP